jgi:hypothetical protein
MACGFIRMAVLRSGELTLLTAQNEMPNEKCTGVVHSIKEHFAGIDPTVSKTDEWVYLPREALSDVDWRALQIGDWVSYTPAKGPEGKIRAMNAVRITPSDAGKQQRLLQSYSNEPSMANGVNPRSHRLDGHTSKQAKQLYKLGAMSREDYFGNMSENGLQSVARSHGLAYEPGKRVEIVRGILDSLDQDQ